MEITKEAIEKRLADLEAQRAQHVNNANACSGAIQDCKYWLGVLERAEAESKEEAPALARE